MAKNAQTQPANKGDKVQPYVPTGLEMAMFRNQFYRNNYRRMVLVCLFLLLIVAGLVGYVFYLFSTMPTPTYFATSTDGKVIQLDPLSQPSLSESQLLDFVSDAARASYTFNFKNYRTQINDALTYYYTPEGQGQFKQALTRSRNLEALKQRKLTTTAKVTKPPKILRTGTMQGRYAWEVEIGLQVQYGNENPSNYIDQRIIVKMTVVRVPIWESPAGVGIKTFIVREDVQPQRRN